MWSYIILILGSCLILGYGLADDDKYGSFQYNPNEIELFESIRSGNATTVQNILTNKGFNLTDELKNKALLLVCRKGDLKAVEILIANKANVNYQNSEGATPLHVAAHFGHLDLADTLLKNGASVSIGDRNNFTALIEAIVGMDKNENQEKIVELLLQNGAKDFWAIFGAAGKKGRERALELLIKHGADVNAKTELDYTPIFRVDGPKAAEILIAAGANVNAVTKEATTPLLDLNIIDQPEVVQLLVKSGADVNYLGWGATPLYRASYYNCDTVQILLENGANVNLTSTDGQTALVSAAQKEMEKCVELLLNAGISRELNGGAANAIHLFAAHDMVKIMKFLIETGSDVNSVAFDGLTPLHIAAHEGREESVKMLLENGANVNLLNNSGQTAVMVAKQKGHDKIVDILEKATTTTKSE